MRGTARLNVLVDSSTFLSIGVSSVAVVGPPSTSVRAILTFSSSSDGESGNGTEIGVFSRLGFGGRGMALAAILPLATGRDVDFISSVLPRMDRPLVTAAFGGAGRPQPGFAEFLPFRSTVVVFARECCVRVRWVTPAALAHGMRASSTSE